MLVFYSDRFSARKIFKGFCDITRWMVEKIYDITGWFSREVIGGIREAICARMSEDPDSAFLGLAEFIPLPTCCRFWTCPTCGSE